MDAQLKKHLETVVDSIVNEKPEAAQAAFREYLRTKTQSILGEGKSEDEESDDSDDMDEKDEDESDDEKSEKKDKKSEKKDKKSEEDEESCK